MTDRPRQLITNFVVLDANKHATVENVRPSLYQDLDLHYHRFSGCELIAAHEFHDHWPSWEMHPQGDEIVVLLAGQAQMRMVREPSEQVVTLNQVGEYVIVPRGVWHTAHIEKYAKMLFITPGEGTQNRPIE